jgi:hypothetical protein
LAAYVSGDTGHTDLAAVVDVGELDREEGPLLAADRDHGLSFEGAAVIEDLQVDLAGECLCVGREELLVAVPDQPSRIQDRDRINLDNPGKRPP